MAFAANRVGPVSQYGQLQAGKNAQGKGRIYGSCPAYSTSGNEVAVQGMSLFWSMTKDAGINFWNGDVIKGLVDKHKIQLIRAPMGVDGSWEDDVGNYYTNSMHETAMNAVVQAAIDNDIYVLIDYHSHCAEKNTSGAAQFFSKMAQKWGKYDNVIFEIYNEPKHGDCNEENPWYDAAEAKNYWKSNIYPYANAVISEIRKYSDNLVVVGTPYYDQYVDAAAVQPINDKNVAYTFHYYAGEEVQNSEWTHKVDGLGKNPENMMNKGYSVFVTEWGNSGPSGDGGFTKSYSAAWYNWMKQNQLSGANWSVSNKAETASYFNTGVSASTPSSQWSYTESGEWTNTNVFAGLPSTYKACNGSTPVVTSSSSTQSSSSVVRSSSSVYVSSSSVQPILSSSSQQVLSSSSVQQPSSSATIAGNVKVSGSLNQTVAQNGSFQTITFENVTSYSRDSWNLHFLNVPQQAENGKVVISGSIPEYAEVGEKTETLTINGQKVTISLNVLPKGSEIPSSSSQAVESSDSQGPVSSGTTSIAAVQQSSLKVTVSNRSLNVAGVASAEVDVFDFQGRPMTRLRNVSGFVDLSRIPNGNYIVRVRAGSMNLTRKISLQ